MNKKNWITSPFEESCVTFKKELTLNKKVKSAVINLTAMGWFNLYVNGERIDKSAFAPGWTDYTRRIQYYSYDVTNFIKDKNVTLAVDVGNGWAGALKLGTSPEITKPAYFPKSLIFELKVTYEDGTNEIFVSDETVDIYKNEVVFDDIYDGEVQDVFRKPEKIGKAKYIDLPCEIIPQEGEDIIFGERIAAKKMFVDNAGNTIIDFGQNFTGNIEVIIENANDGDILSFTPGEVLDEKGVFYNENYRNAKSTYTFTLSKKKAKYMAKFSFMGGRYIKLISFPNYVKKENFTAVLIHSDMKKTCVFECGNKDLQRLYLNNVYGQLSNYLDVPTDCPQRDERLGWTADTQVFSSTAAINFNVNKFLTKWINDLILDQLDDGAILGINPRAPKCTWGSISTGWGDASTIVPFEIYKAYGDPKILEKSIDMMEKWIGYELSKCRKPNIVKLDMGFGDWCALDKGYSEGGYPGLTRLDLVDTAFTLNSIKILIDSLQILGRDYSKYEKIYEEMKKAYQEEFIKDGHMIGPKTLIFSQNEKNANTQTGIVLTLQFNLCEEKDRESLFNDLVENIKECETRLTTGFLGTPYLLHVLSNNGRQDVAYDLLFQTRYPSWLYSVKKGATTFWEHYDGIKEDNTLFEPGMNSYNHYAYGSVFNWMFNNISGIQIVKPGYKEILIKPLPDKRVGYVNCEFESKYGKIKSNWKYIDDNRVEFNVEVPAGIKSTIIFPDGKVMTLNEAKKISYIC